MDEAESQSPPGVDGDTGTEDVVRDEDLANSRRRQQVRQACQQCRRRKIKCDEVRPACRPCLNARLACSYELPPGKTRAQAMIESQQRLQDELRSHQSIIHSLRCVDTNTAMQMLGLLRRGVYDSALWRSDDASQSSSLAERVYPWEKTADEMHRQDFRNAQLQPPINDSLLVCHDGGPLYPSHRSATDKAGDMQTFHPDLTIPHSTSATRLNSGSMLRHNPRMSAYQTQGYGVSAGHEQDLPASRSAASIKTPSNDPNLHYAGPR